MALDLSCPGVGTGVGIHYGSTRALCALYYKGFNSRFAALSAVRVSVASCPSAPKLAWLCRRRQQAAAERLWVGLPRAKAGCGREGGEVDLVEPSGVLFAVAVPQCLCCCWAPLGCLCLLMLLDLFLGCMLRLQAAAACQAGRGAQGGKACSAACTRSSCWRRH